MYTWLFTSKWKFLKFSNSKFSCQTLLHFSMESRLGAGKLVCANLDLFNEPPATMQCQLVQLVEAELNRIRKAGSKQNQTFSWNFCKIWKIQRKIISTKCCWRHPSSNIFMVHWRSGRKGGICWENGKSLPQSWIRISGQRHSEGKPTNSQYTSKWKVEKGP